MTVVAGGDVLNERLVNDAGAAFAAPGERYDFAPVFAPVAPIVADADLAICHLELPVGRRGESAGVRGRSTMGGNLLLAPFEIAEGLATVGFDRCSTASNHSFDLGHDGIVSTLDALDEAGLGHDGTARAAEGAEIGTNTVITVNGIRVVHLSYTTFWNTDPPAERWMLRRAATPEQIAADVTTARAAGAEVVLVSVHLAKELLREPLAGDRQFVTELTALARVDLIVHHGPHVVQPVEWVNDTVVYWSVGNFVSGMGVPGTGKYEDPRTLDGLLARVRFTETAPGRFTAEPESIAICNERRARTVHPPVAVLAADVASPNLSDQLRGELQACVDRTTAIVGDIR